MGEVQQSVESFEAELARLWDGRDVDALISEAARSLAPGSATDWGMASAAESALTPISLGGGIPDPDTLPKDALLAAVGTALAVADDAALRYGGALGSE